MLRVNSFPLRGRGSEYAEWLRPEGKQGPEMGSGMHAAVVEADPIYREGLVRVMSSAGFVQPTMHGSLEDLIASAQSSTDETLLLINLGQAMVGIADDVAALRRRFSRGKIVVLAESGSERFLVNALQAGVDGLLMKPIGCDALIKSLELVMLGEKIFPANFIRNLAFEPAPSPVQSSDQNPVMEKLSARELDVLQELSIGSPNKIIARRFGITEATVKVHVKAILRKFGVRNRTEAALCARNQGATFSSTVGNFRQASGAL